MERGEDDFGVFAFEAEGGGDVGDDEDVGEELMDHGADRFAGADDVRGPCEAPYWRGEHLVFAGGAEEVFGEDEGLP